MAETQDASIGWGGEFHFHDGVALYEAQQVRSIKLPPNVRERVDKTHLKSPGKRRQSIAGLYADGEATVTLNYRPLSDTDTKLLAAVDAGDVRQIKMVVPEDGVSAMEATFNGVITGYDPDEITPDGLMTATVTIAVQSTVAQAPAA